MEIEKKKQKKNISNRSNIIYLDARPIRNLFRIRKASDTGFKISMSCMVASFNLLIVYYTYYVCNTYSWN